ncbi:MAG: zinc ribbon domain-containing protein [Candidatus Zixiibacteriota bacterium]|nr:MAG: zinc ribbon domain-containing protein [candidate division Zixibacteria bacterium]
MPTYEYACRVCGRQFEQYQSMTEAPLAACPACGGEVRRLVSGGAGFIFKGSGQGRVNTGSHSCSLEQTGRTCCGRNERCGEPSCEGGS